MDWKKSYLGKVKFSHFDVSSHSSKRLFVATESNVLAALNSRTGHIIWRVVMEETSGEIDALLHQGSFLITISGGGKFVRSWDTGSGSLLWENMVYAGPLTETAKGLIDGWNGLSSALIEYKKEKSIVVLTGNVIKSFSLQDGTEMWTYQPSDQMVILHALLYSKGLIQTIGTRNNEEIVIQSLTADKGALKSSQEIPAKWIGLESPSCTIVKSSLICVDSTTLVFHVIQLEDDKKEMVDIPLSSFTGDAITGSKLKLQALGSHTNSWVSRSEFVLHISDNHHFLFSMNTDASIKVLKEYSDNSILFSSILNDRAILVSMTMDDMVINLHCIDLDTNTELADMTQKVKLDINHHGNPTGGVVYLFSKKDQNIGYRVFLLTSDNAMSLIQQPGRIMWSREEALAGIAAVDVVELPFSPAQANFDTLQEEFGSNPQDDVLSMFIRRIRAQAKQFQALVKQFQAFVNTQQGRMTTTSDTTTSDDEQLTRDQFNLRKLLLTVTDAGKIYGLDSLDGSILWQSFLPDLAPFSTNNKNFYLLYTQRTVAHFPLPAQCVVLGKSRQTGGTILYVFNPVNGKPLDKKAPEGKLLPFKVAQAMLLPQIDSKHAKLLLLLDTEKKIHVFPDTKEANKIISKQRSSLFFYLVNKEEGALTGYITYASQDNTLHAKEMWNIHIPPNQQKITTLGIKSPAEHVHSQGKVLGDRRVLYRYLNPNLISVGTEAITDGKPSISIYLIDVVTGLIVYTNRHKNARGPIQMVHSENWVVYSLYNTKSRRNELVVLEMYEGYKERNSTAFSSLDPPPQPIILQQSYIFPTAIRSMTVTITERGITHRNLLIGLQSGYVVSVSKNFLDPRRTFNPTQEDREEGLYPYMPELSLNPLAFINYNQTVTHIREIHTAASGLESTCLVFTYGLDLFWIRVTPSRMFDVLKEDFDYWLIAGTLLILVLVTVVSNRLASMKMLRLAWQ